MNQFSTHNTPVMDSHLASCRPAFWKSKNIVQALKFGSHQISSYSRMHYRDNFENNSRLLKLKAVIWVSTYTHATVYWCCTVRQQEKYRKSWPTGTNVRSLVPKSEYSCEISKVSSSKLNFESNSEIFRYDEIARKNCDGMTDMLLKDFTFKQRDFRLFWRGCWLFSNFPFSNATLSLWQTFSYLFQLIKLD